MRHLISKLRGFREKRRPLRTPVSARESVRCGRVGRASEECLPRISGGDVAGAVDRVHDVANLLIVRTLQRALSYRYGQHWGQAEVG